MSKNLNHCEWCGKPTMMGKLDVAEIPIMEWMEKRIDKLGRRRVWGEQADWTKFRLNSNDEAALLMYDDSLSNIKPRTICAHCLVEDERLYREYYENEDNIFFEEQ